MRSRVEIPSAPRVPPIDTDAEMALLGSMLCWAPDCPHGWGIRDVRAMLGPEAFALADHTLIFRTILQVADAGDPVELLSVEPRLQVVEPRPVNEWCDYLLKLYESFADAANALFYARKVRDAWRKRELIRACNAAASDAYAALADPSEIAATLGTRLQGIEQGSASDKTPVAEADLLRAMRHPANDATQRIRLPFLPRLEHLLCGGLHAGELVVVGARPSHGKTSFALQACVSQAGTSEGVPSLFVSAEMSAAAVGLRLLSMRSGIPMRDLRAGRLDEGAFIAERNKAILGANSGAPVYIIADVRDVHAICAIARHHARRFGVKLVAVDYLQRLFIRGDFDTNNLRVGAMSERFKSLASDADVALILCCQLTRGSEREARAPTLADLRDSGAIEQDADTALLIHKPRDLHRPSTITVAKQRQGDAGADVEAYYDRNVMCFRAASLEPETADRAGSWGR